MTIIKEHISLSEFKDFHVVKPLITEHTKANEAAPTFAPDIIQGNLLFSPVFFDYLSPRSHHTIKGYLIYIPDVTQPEGATAYQIAHLGADQCFSTSHGKGRHMLVPITIGQYILRELGANKETTPHATFYTTAKSQGVSVS